MWWCNCNTEAQKLASVAVAGKNTLMTAVYCSSHFKVNMYKDFFFKFILCILREKSTKHSRYKRISRFFLICSGVIPLHEPVYAPVITLNRRNIYTG